MVFWVGGLVAQNLHFSAIYQLFLNDNQIGVQTKTLTQDDGVFYYTNQIKPQGLARLFIKPILQKSVLSVETTMLKLSEFSEQKGKREPFRKTVYNEDSTMDVNSLDLLMMQLAGQTTITTKVISSKKTQTYHFTLAQKTSQLYQYQYQKNPDDTTEIWLDKRYGFLPSYIRQKEPKKTLEIKLTEAHGNFEF